MCVRAASPFFVASSWLKAESCKRPQRATLRRTSQAASPTAQRVAHLGMEKVHRKIVTSWIALTILCYLCYHGSFEPNPIRAAKRTHKGTSAIWRPRDDCPLGPPLERPTRATPLLALHLLLRSSDVPERCGSARSPHPYLRTNGSVVQGTERGEFLRFCFRGADLRSSSRSGRSAIHVGRPLGGHRKLKCVCVCVCGHVCVCFCV